jgi:hypothetical protein
LFVDRGGIDGARGWRYSQAQIPDLVAYTIPRFRRAAQGSRLGKSNALKIPTQPEDLHPTIVWLCALSVRWSCAEKTALFQANQTADEVLYVRPEVAGNGSNRNTFTVHYR